MSTEIAAEMPASDAKRGTTARSATGSGHLTARHLLPPAITLLAGLAWYVRTSQPYTPASNLGYWMGVAGGLLMAALLVYPLRKRVRWTQSLGPLRHWFRFHMIAGIAGPLLVLYHSTFRVGSFNAAIALGSMLLVAASGVVGRFLYRRIHQGLYGREATLRNLQESLTKQLAGLEHTPASLPAVRAEFEEYLRHINVRHENRLRNLLHFAGLGWRRRSCLHRVKTLIPRQAPTRQAIADTLGAAQQAAQFNAYVRLFALWHVVHIPFLGMLVLTAVAHVIAVHTY